MRKVKGGCVCDDDGSHGKKVIGAAVIMTVTVVWKKSDSINEDETKTVQNAMFFHVMAGVVEGDRAG